MAARRRGPRLISATVLPKVQVKLRRSRTKALANEIAGVMSNASVLAEAYIQRETQAPSSPRRPINWTTPRQQKAYFLSNGFGNGMPYDRSGDVESGWFMDATKAKQRQEYSFTIGNDVPYATFVYGGFTPAEDRQQVFHWISRWPNVRGLDERTYETVIRPAVEAGILNVMAEHEQQLTFGLTQLLYEAAQRTNAVSNLNAARAARIAAERASAINIDEKAYRGLGDVGLGEKRAIGELGADPDKAFEKVWAEFIHVNYEGRLKFSTFYDETTGERKATGHLKRMGSSYKRVKRVRGFDR